MQNWLRLNNYTREYLNLVYNYYSRHAVCYNATYYHLDIPRSTLDKTVFDAGSYSDVGDDLSGARWEKISLFPIYNVQPINPNFIADERGFTKIDQSSSFNIPSIYGLTPTTADYIYFNEDIINEQGQGNKSLYKITNLSKSVNSFVTFWQLNIKVDFRTKDQVEQYVDREYCFFEYEKLIYDIDTAIELQNLLEKNKSLNINSFFDKKIGLYTGI